MSYEFYRILHLIGIFGLMLSLGGMAVHIMNGGNRASFTARKFLGALHGVSLFIVIVAGFGLIARLGVGFPGWVIAKLVIWLILGGLPAMIYKKPNLSKILFFLVWVLGGCAAVLAIAKPF